MAPPMTPNCGYQLPYQQGLYQQSQHQQPPFQHFRGYYAMQFPVNPNVAGYHISHYQGPTNHYQQALPPQTHRPIKQQGPRNPEELEGFHQQYHLHSQRTNDQRPQTMQHYRISRIKNNISAYLTLEKESPQTVSIQDRLRDLAYQTMRLVNNDFSGNAKYEELVRENRKRVEMGRYMERHGRVGMTEEERMELETKAREYVDEVMKNGESCPAVREIPAGMIERAKEREKELEELAKRGKGI